MIRTIFTGSSEFGRQVLTYLLSIEQLDITAIITQPDAHFGRSSELKTTPVKELARFNTKHINIYEPDNLVLEILEILEKEKPELILVCSYGKILPSVMLDYPKYKCLNIHASLLPTLRGATPIQSAILLGLEKTGVTLQIMSQKMDRGDIVSQQEVMLDSEDDYFSLTKKLLSTTEDLLKRDLAKYINGEITPCNQEDKYATYCFKADTTYEKAKLDLTNDALTLSRQIKAFVNEPVCWIERLTIDHFVDDSKSIHHTNHKIEKHFKIFKANILKELDIPVVLAPSESLIYDKRLFFKTRTDFLEVIELQEEGKKRIRTNDYMNGVINKLKLQK